MKADRSYERLNGEQELMTGVAAFFGIDPAYLPDKSGPIPDALEQQLELVRQVRMREVRVYATRKLVNVSPRRWRSSTGSFATPTDRMPVDVRLD